jgi:hypothetical protein
LNTSSSYKSNIIKPTYKTQFVKNREYDGITRTNPKQLRFRIPSSSSSYSRGLFNFFDKSNNNRNLFKFYDKKTFFKGKSNNNKKSEPAQVNLEPSNNKKPEPAQVTNKKPGFSFPSMFKKTPSCFNKINKSKINRTIVRQQYISRKNDPNIYKKLYKEYTGEDNCTNENINKFKSFVGIPYIPISTPNIDKNTDLSNILARLEKLKEQI